MTKHKNLINTVRDTNQSLIRRIAMKLFFEELENRLTPSGQTLTTVLSAPVAQPNEQITVTVNYSAADVSMGLGMRVIYDPAQLTLVGTTNVLPTNLIGVQQQGNTVLGAWADWNQNFPVSNKLLDLVFQTNAGFTGTTLSYQQVSVPAGFDNLNAPDVNIGLGSSTPTNISQFYNQPNLTPGSMTVSANGPTTVSANQIFSITISLAATQLSTGLGLSLGFDPSQITLLNVSSIYQGGTVQQQGNTVVAGWVDPSIQFPTSANLFTVTFQASSSFTGTTLNFNSISVPSGFSIALPSLTIS